MLLWLGGLIFGLKLREALKLQEMYDMIGEKDWVCFEAIRNNDGWDIGRPRLQ
jgi:hypothetical protein